ncbi:MAG: HAD hydrolase-like protein [Sedimentisphaerales bacterium]|nr:HAD hydrolase-like protein [Sedimentisphaerales bacterium]
MKRFFDYPQKLWEWFETVDKRFAVDTPPTLQPAHLSVEIHQGNLSDIHVVLWDVYGTLLGVEVGDLEQSHDRPDRLEEAARLTIAEFNLETPLVRLYPGRDSAVSLRERYLKGIDDSHLQSAGRGVQFPEVVIQQIWLDILNESAAVGWNWPYDEPRLYTAYRIAYFFDAALQQVYLYPHAADCLVRLKDADVILGIISNAQFYTPLHLRRLLRRELKNDQLRLNQIFTDTLMFFSYELGFSKPNPRAFQRAGDLLARQGITREEILYIGNDMLNDVWAALRAGTKAALCAVDATQTTLRENDDRCRGLKPDAVITDLSNLADRIVGTKTV